jgi:trigger factor
MKTTLTRESPTTVRLNIEATEEDLAPATDRAFAKLAREVKVPGFRKGHVPPKVIEARLGKAAIREVALREAIPVLYAQAVVDEQLEPIAPPKIEVTSPDDAPGLNLDVTIEVRPEIRMPDYQGITVNRPSAAVTGEEVDEQLKRMQDRFAQLETVPRNASSGDYVLMNLRTYVNDTTIDAATGTDLLYELGAGGFVPELDAQLEAKRAGDVVQFNTTLPESYGGDFAGKEVTCQVLVKEVRVKQLPALDDEFAKTASEFDTLDELRADLRSKLAALKSASVDAEVRSRVLETLVGSSDFDVPNALIEEEFAFRLERFAEQLRAAGMSVDDYLAQTQQTEAQVESDVREQAERNVRAQLLLEEIGKAEGLQASDEELAQEIARHAQALRTDPNELREQLQSKGRLGALAGDIIRRKALDSVVARADVRYEDPDEAAAATAESGQSETASAATSETAASGTATAETADRGSS